jgi:uncharacterized protein (TIGR03083 family)
VHDSVENLARIWSSIDDLCRAFTEEEWKRPTALPGWNVQDNLSHLVDYESRAIGRPGPDHEPVDISHTRNPIAEANEIGVDYRRRWPGSRVLQEFREVTAARLAQLRAFTDEDLAQPVQTPAGPGTMSDLLNLRVMDSWAHEQDMRRAVGRPGHLEGPAVDQALAHFISFLPYVVGKRAAAAEGATVVVTIAGHPAIGIEVVDGRARRSGVPSTSPDVKVSTDVATFAALVNGRVDGSEAEVEIVGDHDLGRKIVANLNVMI